MTLALFDELTQRVEQLLLRHQELLRNQRQLQAEVLRLTQERDQLMAQCQSARHRLEALIQQLSVDEEGSR